MRTTEIRINHVGDAVFNASRQVWLASLGAAVVTRDWAQAEAGSMFRILVKEGTLVESRGSVPPRNSCQLVAPSWSGSASGPLMLAWASSVELK